MGEPDGSDFDEGVDVQGDANLLAVGQAPLAPAGGAVLLAEENKPKRDRELERETEAILTNASTRFMDGNGVVDVGKMSLVLRRALYQLDPSQKDKDQDSAIVSVLRDALRAQDNGSTSASVNRAIVDTMAVGVSQGKLSARDVAKKLGVSRKRLRGVEHASFPQSVQKKRKTRSDATSSVVLQAMKEFVYCYCKYLEKTYVCLLTRQMVLDLYNQFHDEEGRYYVQGTPSTRTRTRTHTQRLTPLLASPRTHTHTYRHTHTHTHTHTQVAQLGWIGTSAG